MALIGDSGLSGLAGGNPSAQPTQAPERENESTSGGGGARRGERGDSVVVDLSAEGRAAIRASDDAVSATPADSGAGDREVEADARAAERREDEARVREEERAEDRRRDELREDRREERERVDLRA